MEYRFSVSLNGQYDIRMSMGHEAIGLCILEEIDLTPEELLASLYQIKHKHSQTYTYKGHQFFIDADYLSVSVSAIDESFSDNLEMQADELCEDMTSIYAECGLEDFIQMLESWINFISEHPSH